MQLQYLHTSEQNVQPGDSVVPTTVLGKTGSTGTDSIRLVIKARNEKGTLINSEEAFSVGSVQP